MIRRIGSFTFLTAVSLVATTTTAQLEQNRLELHNGGDLFWYINDPMRPGDPENGDFDADMVYKIYPGYAMQRCSGEAELVAHTFSLYDADWGNDTTIPCMVIDRAVESSSGEIAPDPYDGVHVLLPPIEGTSFGAPPCPDPGEFAGYEVQEEFLDFWGNPDPVILDADDVDDHWAMSTFAVGPNSTGTGSPNDPAVNSCGEPGDVMLFWHGSTAYADPWEGEQQPDWLSTGTSAYSGFQGGTELASGVNDFVPDTPDAGVASAWHFSEPTMQMNTRVDTDQDFVLGPVGVGLVGLNPPINWDTVVVGAGPELGFVHGDGAAHSVSGGGTYVLPFSIGFTNLGAPLIDLFSCVPWLGTELALDPSDSIFTLFTGPWGINGFVDEDHASDPARDQATSTSDLVPVTPGGVLVGLNIKVQTFTIDLGSGLEAVGSQVWRFTLH